MMNRLTKMIGAALVAASLGLVVSGISQAPETANAAVKTHKLTSLPKAFRGTWYTSYKGKGRKIKASAKKFDISTYRHALDRNSYSAASEQYFTPYRLSGKKIHKQTLYLLNGIGLSTVRRTTIKGKPVLIQYNEQEHGTILTIFTRTKKASVQKVYSGFNPFGMSVYTRKDALKNRKFYRTIDPIVRKQFGAAVKKKVDKGGKTGKFKHINVVSYTAYGFWEGIAN
ncbi:hypothetical protein ACFQ44_02260 [Levilactobacillus lanxiensis]|uniref:Uncharacterized protein n=2 Tax=Levilactobacillus lanxiensis TaxID=2799568 RepID=A0ABW4D1Q9_9LACO|nr:hypothetical protein [Levilactobacillus lanxiensis]